MLDDIPLDLPLAFRCPTSGETLDLNALLTPRTISTFYMRVAGHGLRAHGVLDGDLLVIDRSIPPSPGVLVVAEHRGEFLLCPWAGRTASGCWCRCDRGRYPSRWRSTTSMSGRSLAWRFMRSTTWGLGRPGCGGVSTGGGPRKGA
ncbi:MAG: LexA family protein [Synechococcaceae cyanobacterium]